MSALPVALATDTILECVFEARVSAGRQSSQSLLPGLIFAKLEGLFTRSVALPLAMVPPLQFLPKAVRDQNPQLMYGATHALEGADVRMFIGPHMVSVAFQKPYAGWSKVQPLILRCMGAAFETGFVGAPERFSLKYINLLQHGRDAYDLSQIALNLGLAEFERRREGTLVRVEIEKNDCISVVEIASGAKVAPSGAEGVLLTVDTIKDAPKIANVSVELPLVLETLHTTEKQIFFGLLTKKMLEKLGPRYAATN